MFILKAFQCNTLVHQHIHNQNQQHNHSHAILCFTHFFSDDSKQDSSTTAVHIKCIIELFNQHSILYYKLSTLWENTYCYAEEYNCSTAL